MLGLALKPIVAIVELLRGEDDDRSAEAPEEDATRAMDEALEARGY